MDINWTAMLLDEIERQSAEIITLVEKNEAADHLDYIKYLASRMQTAAVYLIREQKK